MTHDHTRPNPATSKLTGRPFSLKKWLLLGAAFWIVIPTAGVFLYGWTSGRTLFDPAMLAHNPPPPLSRAAAFNAMIHAYLFALFVGLPLFILWSIVCGIVALSKRGPSV